MLVRIHRTWKWVLAAVDPRYGPIGGKQEYKLVAIDEPQYCKHNEWIPFPIVEEPKPPHPEEERILREHNEGIKNFISGIVLDKGNKDE